MVSDVREARSEEELLTSQREVDAIIGGTLKCCDGAIEQEDMAAFGAAKGYRCSFQLVRPFRWRKRNSTPKVVDFVLSWFEPRRRIANR